MENPVSLNGFIQICLVVDDAAKAATAWANLFGVPVPAVEVRSFMPDPNQSYRGEVANYSVKVANIITPQGFVIEIHEPDENPSTFREFLDAHGNGVHHLGFEVGDRRDAIVDEMAQLGYALRTIGDYPGSSWTIVDTEGDLGVNLNIKPVR